MEKQEKKRGLVSGSGVMAGAMASVAAAFFTSRLGVAGTLIGAALTSMVITLGSAILNASLDRAKTRVSALPSTVRGRLSTQQIRVPGRPSPGPDPARNDEESLHGGEPRRRDRRTTRRSSGLFGRLSATLSNFGLLPASARRRVLVVGALAGVLAAVIGLTAITGIEAAAGRTFSCLGRDCSVQGETAPGGGSQPRPRTSVGSIFGTATGGGGGGSPRNASPVDGQETPVGGGEEEVPAQPSAGDGGGVRQIPQDEAPAAGEGQQEGPASPVTPTPEDPGQQPDVETPATPGEDGGVVEPAPTPPVEPTPTPPVEPAPPIEEQPPAEPAPRPGEGETPVSPDAGAAGQQPSDGQ